MYVSSRVGPIVNQNITPFDDAQLRWFGTGKYPLARITNKKAWQTRHQIIVAAVKVFHECGVNRASLEKIAESAGLTRGAIYWHFRDKAEILYAVRKTILSPRINAISALINTESYANPLDAITEALAEIFRSLEEEPDIRAVIETIYFRCEHVAEFEPIRSEVDVLARRFRKKFERAYGNARLAGYLRAGLDPEYLAVDTLAFIYGLIRQHFSDEINLEPARLIEQHINFRRSG